MSTEATPTATPVALDAPPSPFDLLANFPDGPSASQIATWQQQVPGGRVRLLPLSRTRIFVLRGFSSTELAEIQAEVLKVPEAKQLSKLQAIVAERCTLWTSVTTHRRLTEADLQQSGAGLAPTLYQAIADLSDFTEPAYLEQMYMDF